MINPPTHPAGFILAHKVSLLCAPMGLGASVALTTTGFVLQTRGLKAGNTIIVCTMAAVASMGSGEQYNAGVGDHYSPGVGA